MPTDQTQLPSLTQQDLYETYKELKSSHSGYGNSFWSVSANCGKQRKLAQTLPVVKSEEPVPEWAARGIGYHLLQQAYHDGKTPDLAIDLSDEDPQWQEALTLHSWYREVYGSTSFGKCIGTEVQFPANDFVRDIVAQYFGLPSEFCPTIRADAMFEIDDATIETLGAHHDLLLPGPGLYIMDFKTGAAHWKEDAKTFGHGVQSVLYQTVCEILGLNPKGMIFNKVSMTKEKGKLVRKDGSFRNYVAAFDPVHTPARAKGMIQHAYKSMLAGEPNGYACTDCPFYEKQCFGY